MCARRDTTVVSTTADGAEQPLDQQPRPRVEATGSARVLDACARRHEGACAAGGASDVLGGRSGAGERGVGAAQADR
jgi:hypothetical protein